MSSSLCVYVCDTTPPSAPPSPLHFPEFDISGAVFAPAPPVPIDFASGTGAEEEEVEEEEDSVVWTNNDDAAAQPGDGPPTPGATRAADRCEAPSPSRCDGAVHDVDAAATCMICMDEGPTMTLNCCGQAAHVRCMARWLDEQETCPHCRALQDEPERSGQEAWGGSATMDSDDDFSAFGDDDDEVDTDGSDSDAVPRDGVLRRYYHGPPRTPPLPPSTHHPTHGFPSDGTGHPRDLQLALVAALIHRAHAIAAHRHGHDNDRYHHPEAPEGRLGDEPERRPNRPWRHDPYRTHARR